EEVVQLVPGDREQPAAEGAAAGVVVEPAGRGRHGPEDLLHEGGGVGVLQAAAAGEAGGPPRGQLPAPPPSLPVAPGAEARQQAGTGRRGLGHAAPSLSRDTGDGAKPYRDSIQYGRGRRGPPSPGASAPSRPAPANEQDKDRTST